MFDCGINEIIGDVVTSIEKEKEKMVYKAVQSVGIDVDKEQLEKALFNAKSFYIDGYKDAKKQYQPKWIKTDIIQYPETYPSPFQEVWETDEYGNVTHRAYGGERNIIAWMPFVVPEPYKENEE